MGLVLPQLRCQNFAVRLQERELLDKGRFKGWRMKKWPSCFFEIHQKFWSSAINSANGRKFFLSFYFILDLLDFGSRATPLAHIRSQFTFACPFKFPREVASLRLTQFPFRTTTTFSFCYLMIAARKFFFLLIIRYPLLYSVLLEIINCGPINSCDPPVQWALSTMGFQSTARVLSRS